MSLALQSINLGEFFVLLEVRIPQPLVVRVVALPNISRFTTYMSLYKVSVTLQSISCFTKYMSLYKASVTLQSISRIRTCHSLYKVLTLVSSSCSLRSASPSPSWSAWLSCVKSSNLRFLSRTCAKVILKFFLQKAALPQIRQIILYYK